LKPVLSFLFDGLVPRVVRDDDLVVGVIYLDAGLDYPPCDVLLVVEGELYGDEGLVFFAFLFACVQMVAVAIHRLTKAESVDGSAAEEGDEDGKVVLTGEEEEEDAEGQGYVRARLANDRLYGHFSTLPRCVVVSHTTTLYLLSDIFSHYN